MFKINSIYIGFKLTENLFKPCVGLFVVNVYFPGATIGLHVLVGTLYFLCRTKKTKEDLSLI